MATHHGGTLKIKGAKSGRLCNYTVHPARELCSIFSNQPIVISIFYSRVTMNYSLLLILACCVVLSGCGPTTVNTLVEQQGAQQLAAQDVLALVTGNTLRVHSFDEDASLYFDPSGRLFGKVTASEKDRGKWDVSQGGELCFRMNTWWYGDLRCFQVYSVADANRLHLASAGGVIQYSAAQEEGDSRHLYTQEDQQKKSLRRSIRKEQAQNVQQQEDLRAPAVIDAQPTPSYGNRDTGATVEYMAKDCPGCNLAGADLGKAELIGAKLAGADLHGANLSMANLRRADLQGANLRDAVLAYTNMPGANLQGADLRGAILKGANLIKADLTGANLEGADLTEVLREGAKGLK